MSRRDDIADPNSAAFQDSLFQNEADRVYRELLSRIGEAAPQPRLEPTRRVVELLGDPQQAYPIVHITGTNGKTSTSRIIESILRAHGLRTGLMTSPHLVRVNERIVIDGQPISNQALVANWDDIQPYLLMVDAELMAAGNAPLTFFEALTALTFASFADAPVDVAVIEVGMGGEWDSTNVGDGQVAVFTPVALDHTARLGNTVAKIARTKSGIIKPSAFAVSAEQSPEALTEIERAAVLSESKLAVQGVQFRLESSAVAVGGQVITVQGLAGVYHDLFLPMFGDHQAQNATVAIAAVEAFLGSGGKAIAPDVLAEGLATASSPGRLQIVGTEPTVLVDAAHNPHGAVALAKALTTYFTFDRVICVLGILGDKDAAGIVRALAGVVDEFIITQSRSERAIDADVLAELVSSIAGPERVTVDPSSVSAVKQARERVLDSARGAVLVTGSITLIGEVIPFAEDSGWKP